MKATDYGGKNPLRYPTCDEYRYLNIKGVRSADGDKELGMKIPFFECRKCDVLTPVVPHLGIYDSRVKAEAYYKDIFKKELATMNPGELCSLKTVFEKKEFKHLSSVGFKYDSQDYYFIPGLLSMFGSDEGFLTPVFFDKKVLIYYNNLPDFKVVLSSFSRVHITNIDGTSLIPHGFGITRSGKVVCWLGDLHEEFSKPRNEHHLKIFQAFNVDSDNDIVSDYYYNQIEANFMDSDNEHKIFDLRNDFDEKVNKHFGFALTKFNFEELISDYKHPIINERNQINLAYKKLHSMLNETLAVDEIKSVLLKSGVTEKETKGLGGIKLFQLFLEKVIKLSDAKDLVCPLFVLYDLRILGEHITGSDSEEKYSFCKKRLSIPDSSDDLQVFEKLIQDLIKMYEKLCAAA